MTILSTTAGKNPLEEMEKALTVNKRVQNAVAAATKSLQSCPTFCDPMDCSPPGSSVHVILQGRILEWAAISFSTIMYKSMTNVSESKSILIMILNIFQLW